ncbi:MAG: DUF5011 domain-containing protein [bacterium]|nr:DUF5011 domain-containing protein [bacterium]
MKRFLHFVQYHNAATIILVLVFGAASTTFAASEDARRVVFESTDEVVAVDNTYLLAQDIDTFPFNVEITAVQQDDTFYYIDYSYVVMDIVDHVWKQVSRLGSIKVSHREIQGRDLGAFVSEQLGQMIDYQRSEFKEIQNQETKKGRSPKVVATKYSGLVGRLLDSKTKEFPGYEPVVKPAPKPPKEKKRTAKSTGINVSPKVAQEVNTIVQSATRSSESAPTISIRGANPARVPTGSSYSDWGVSLKDDKDDEEELRLLLKVEGDKKIDTSTPAIFEVKYIATDSDGNISTAVRIVEVLKDPYATQYEVVEDDTDDVVVASSTEETASSSETTAEATEEEAVEEETEVIVEDEVATTTEESTEEGVEEPETMQEETASSTETTVDEPAEETTEEEAVEEEVATSTETTTEETTTEETEETTTQEEAVEEEVATSTETTTEESTEEDVEEESTIATTTSQE